MRKSGKEGEEKGKKEGQMHREREQARGGPGLFLAAHAFSLPASVPKRPEFTLFLEDASTPFNSHLFL